MGYELCLAGVYNRIASIRSKGHKNSCLLREGAHLVKDKMQATESMQTWTETDPRTPYLQRLNFLGSSFLKVKAGTTDHRATVVNAQSRHLQRRQKPGSGINYLPDLFSFKPSGQAQPSPQVRRDTLGSPKEPQQPHLARYAPCLPCALGSS